MSTTAKDDTRIWVLRVAKVVVWIIYLFVLTALVILLIAFFLRLFGANPTNGFTEWIYRAADRIMEPFRGIFPTKTLTEASVLDYSLLFAVIMYTIFALVAHWIVHVVSRKLSGLTSPPPPAVYQYVVPPPTTNVNVGPGQPGLTPAGGFGPGPMPVPGQPPVPGVGGPPAPPMPAPGLPPAPTQPPPPADTARSGLPPLPLAPPSPGWVQPPSRPSA